MPKRLSAKLALINVGNISKEIDQTISKKSKILSAKQAPIKCPDWFDDIARAEFERVCQVLFDKGTLADVNHATLEGYCAAYSRAIRAEKELKDGFEREYKAQTKKGDTFYIQKKKTEVSVAERAWGQVKMFAVELGITQSIGGQQSEKKDLTPMEKAMREAEQNFNK